MTQPPFLWHRDAVIVPPWQPETGWSRHCQMPTPLRLPSGQIRLYYTTRSSTNQAHVLYVDIEDRPPYRILNRPVEACLAPGPTGYFDAAGVMPTAVLRRGDEVWLYYIGWTVRQDVPYHNGIGLAISRDGGQSFERAYPGPVVGTSVVDPLFCSTADVQPFGDGFLMVYASTTHWCEIDGKMEPRYHLRLARSEDGRRWTPTGQVAVDYRSDTEAACARATLWQDDSGWHMWFCTRDLRGYRNAAEAAYHLDYAHSDDGIHWQRAPKGPAIFANSFAADQGFDDIMQAYPIVFETDAGPLLFYNGDGFGQTGIAVATPQSKS